MITVKDVLDMEQFQEAEVIAGFEGLSKTVNTITISELSDAADWLYGGELVCTSGFIIKNQSTADSLNWIESLAKKNASALLIKTHRFMNQLPHEIIDFANNNDFPIIDIPKEVTWPFLIEAVTELVSDKNLHDLQKSQRVQDRLMQLVLDGADVDVITEKLANMLMNPILVEDGILNTITKAIPIELSNKTQVAEENVRMRMSKGFKQKILRSNYYQNVLNKKIKKTYTINIQNATDTDCVMVPIIANNTVLGFLTIIEAENKIEQSDIDSLEHGSNAIALKLAADMYQERDNGKKELEEIKNLLNGRLNLNTPQNRFLYDAPALVVILISIELKRIERIDKKSAGAKAERESEQIIRKYVGQEVSDYILGYEQNMFTLIIPLESVSQEENLNQLEEMMTNCHEELKKVTSTKNIEIAIGSIHSSINELKESYENAKVTLETIQRTPHFKPVTCADFIGGARLIFEFHDHEFLRSYRDYYLKNLLNEDVDSIFLETLTTYIHYGYNVKQTANAMFVHPNTIIYRLERVKHLLGNSMQNPQYRETLSLAIQIHNYLQSLE